MTERSLGDSFARFTASLLLLVGAAVLQICVLLYGWQLQPHSWTWIIWGVIGQIIILIFSIALR